MLNAEDKRKQIKQKLDTEFNTNKKLVELDFEFNLILSAAQSYKHDTLLKPFPSSFVVNENEQRYDGLVSIDNRLKLEIFFIKPSFFR